MIATSVIWSLASSLTQETGLFEDTNTSRNCSDTQRPSKRMFGAHDCWRIDPQATIFTHPNWPSPRKWLGYQLHVKQGKCPLWVPGSGEKILKARGWKWVEVRGWNVWYTVLQASQIVHQPARFIMIHPWKTHMFCTYCYGRQLRYTHQRGWSPPLKGSPMTVDHNQVIMQLDHGT